MSYISNLQLFVRVVEEGSFSAAARFLGQTPSSVSRQISQLESELKARVFHRTTRKQSLTEAGEIYYRHARRIVSDLAEARLAVNRLTDAPSGRLHITAEADFAVSFIAPIVPEFLEAYPDVQLRLSMSANLVDIHEKGIDIAIRFGHLDDSSLIARKIAISRSVICASPAYLAAHGTPLHPSDLVDHNCLSFRTQPGKKIWNFDAKDASGNSVKDKHGKVGSDGYFNVTVSGSVHADSLFFLRSVTMAGVGISMIPTWMIKDCLTEGTLVPLLPEYPLAPENTPFHAVFANNKHLAPKVRAFVDFLSQRLELL